MIPFKIKNIVDNIWNISEIENNSNGFISIKPNFAQIVNGEIPDEDDYRRSLKNVIKKNPDSIIEEEDELSQKKPWQFSMVHFLGIFLI